jgi:hypothetical protein
VVGGGVDRTDFVREALWNWVKATVAEWVAAHQAPNREE